MEKDKNKRRKKVGEAVTPSDDNIINNLKWYNNYESSLRIQELRIENSILKEKVKRLEKIKEDIIDILRREKKEVLNRIKEYESIVSDGEWTSYGHLMKMYVDLRVEILEILDDFPDLHDGQYSLNKDLAHKWYWRKVHPFLQKHKRKDNER